MKRRVGFIRSPRAAGRHRISIPRGVPFATPTSRTALYQSLLQFARGGLDTIGVIGGDGTLREVLSTLGAAFAGHPRPALAILPAGRTNLIARGLGAVLRDPHQLATADLLTVRRRVVEVRGVQTGCDYQPTLHGMVVGAGALVPASRLGQRIASRGHGPHRASAEALARTLLRMRLRGDPDGIRTGTRAHLRVDGESAPHRRHSLFVATTLERRVLLGRSPFHGACDPHQLRYLDVPAPARGIPRALWALARSQPHRMGAGWQSGVAWTLELQTYAPLFVDGDLYPIAKGGVELRTGPMTTFLGDAQ